MVSVTRFFLTKLGKNDFQLSIKLIITLALLQCTL